MLEILAPAGNEACAAAAINNGANAIYLGLSGFSARQGAGNFDEPSFRAVVAKAHFSGVKVYVAMNTVVKDSELDDFFASLLFAWNNGADAIILQDIFLGKRIKRLYPEMVLHLSTQAGVCTVEGARLAKEYGFSRVILARETPISEIEKIAAVIETEAFVQGALCTAFSGQCYFSSFVGGNSGNRGRCKQPCRKRYAYDRNGNTEKTYALSLSDLCVGEDIQKLINAGVVSFKIEGRMRREEYVAAAVCYYRKILAGEDTKKELSDLKRTYNRGNYTRGLAFGQDKRFLSTAIQGHIGEKVGVVKVIGGRFLVESSFTPKAGDGFKILRDGKEVAGASFVKVEGKAFVVSSKIRLKNGDGVFITTDTSLNERLLSAQKQAEILIKLSFSEGEKPQAICADFVFTGNTPLQSAQSRPLTQEELRACFVKVDGLPVCVRFEEIILKGNSFIPKSELNAFRRAFYEGLVKRVANGGNNIYEKIATELPRFTGRNEKTAVIADDFSTLQPDIAIYKPRDMRAPLPNSFLEGSFEKYLYCPPFITSEDLSALAERLQEGGIDGVYAENYAGIRLAKDLDVKLFAGTGFHLLNGVSLSELLEEENVAYYALSKEANVEEMRGLLGKRAFVLSCGDIRLMDLCYCPFGKTCKQCDKKEIYRLTDEGERVFPVRRYLAADGSCRFEVYNCTNLIGTGMQGAGKLMDLSVTKDKSAVLNAQGDENAQKKVYEGYTSGHFRRGVL